MSGRLTQRELAPFVGQSLGVAGWHETLPLHSIEAAETPTPSR